MAGFWGKRKREEQAALDAQDAEIARRARTALVAADERIRLTTDELSFAEAELGILSSGHPVEPGRGDETGPGRPEPPPSAPNDPPAPRFTSDSVRKLFRDVARAIQQLEPAQRELLWLAYAQGSSHEEIAEILELSAISVRTLLLRARRKLAGILAGGAQ